MKDRDNFDRLFSSSFTQDLSVLAIQYQDMNHSFIRKIREYEVKELLRRMKLSGWNSNRCLEIFRSDGYEIIDRSCLQDLTK